MNTRKLSPKKELFSNKLKRFSRFLVIKHLRHRFKPAKRLY
jgi:hypothetical protein